MMAASTDVMEYLNWFIAFRDPRDIWKNHWSFLVCEVVFLIIGLLTLIHALRQGGRWVWLWVAILFHAFTTECVSYWVPDIDNFWHAQSMVILLGKRLPLHICLVYHVFIYTASVAVSRMHLKSWAEPFAVGLGAVLMDLPFDIVGIKLLFWSWHDTDPSIYDRHYWVPWTSYYFHASFASSLTFLFHGSRRLFAKSNGKFESAGFGKELLCTIIPGLFSFPMGALQFIPVYHVLHDNFHIHTEVCVFVFVTVYLMFIWIADRHPTPEALEARSTRRKGFLDEISIIVLLHYLTYFFFVLVAKPEEVRAIGLHEPTGDCKPLSRVITALGQVLSKRKYLCTKEYDEGYYDFHCLPNGKPPRDGLEWYTICGNPYPNYVEYVVVVTACCALGLVIYLKLLMFGGKTLKSAPKKQKKN